MMHLLRIEKENLPLDLIRFSFEKNEIITIIFILIDAIFG